jgi:hypothetical protein
MGDLCVGPAHLSVSHGPVVPKPGQESTALLSSAMPAAAALAAPVLQQLGSVATTAAAGTAVATAVSAIPKGAGHLRLELHGREEPARKRRWSRRLLQPHQPRGSAAAVASRAHARRGRIEVPLARVWRRRRRRRRRVCHRPRRDKRHVPPSGGPW